MLAHVHIQRGDSVWVKATDGNWHRGTVSALKVKKDKTRQVSLFGLYCAYVDIDVWCRVKGLTILSSLGRLLS